MKNWENLIKIFEKYEEGADFVAECVYAFLCDHCPDDHEFMNDLSDFIESAHHESHN